VQAGSGIVQPGTIHDKSLPSNHVRCGCFRHLVVTSSFYNSDKTGIFNIPSQFDCNSKDPIYIISCAECNKLYVGQTSRMLKERLNNHRSDIKLNKNTAVSKHFNDIGHALKDPNYPYF